MSAFEGDPIEHTLCQIRLIHVFKIPPRATSGGHRAGDWKDEVWQGSLKVVQKGLEAAILLVDPKTNQLFAMCPVKEGSVERAVDSSRYFVLKIQNAQGRHAFIGVAFTEREEAFDFNVALQDYQKDKERDNLIQSGALQAAVDNEPKLNLSIKEGEKIKINLPPGAASSSAADRRKRSVGSGSTAVLLGPPPGASGGGGLLAPPPGNNRKTASRDATSSSFLDTDTGPVPQSRSPAGSSSSRTNTSFGDFGTFDALPQQGPAKSLSPASASNASVFDDWTSMSNSMPAARSPTTTAMKQPQTQATKHDDLADFLS